eukprot:2153170-Rhodomonas_salina.1
MVWRLRVEAMQWPWKIAETLWVTASALHECRTCWATCRTTGAEHGAVADNAAIAGPGDSSAALASGDQKELCVAWAC